jgi:hypothetical protein
MPLGFFVLAAMIVNCMLAKRRQRPGRTHRLSASTQDDGTSHPSALLLSGLELERAAAQPTF